MSPLYNQLNGVLQKYLSPVTSETVIRRALQDARLTPDQLSLQHLPLLAPHVERGIRLFVAGSRQEQLRAELNHISRGASAAIPAPQSVSIQLERDISDARVATRGLCASVGAGSLSMQKAATIVSELARNIVSYTPGGSIELSILDTKPRKLHLRATDSGSGITELDAILGGRYKSNTGLGKGLLGVKRLADSFDIRTGKSGTTIDLTLSL